jgi:hypothetical protein
MLRAAEAEGMRVAWDLCHYGWPDGLDVFSAAFVDRLSRYAAAFARLHLAETGRAPVTCPVNEISFLAWAGGDMGRMNPARATAGGAQGPARPRRHRGDARDAEAVPGTRVLTIEPVIHIAPIAARTPPSRRRMWRPRSRPGT